MMVTITLILYALVDELLNVCPSYEIKIFYLSKHQISTPEIDSLVQNLVFSFDLLLS